jgi:NAD(P)-dependent dehydrogenase (short-subunit alcohol dehydrogenase family)
MSQPVALVTGASSGIGADTALVLAEAGYAVLMVARTADRLDAARQRVVDDVPDAVVATHPADVTDPAACDAAVAEVIERFGRLDALVNCAGSAPLQPILKITDDALDACLAVNLKSVIYLTRSAWPHFRQQKAGVVVSVSSMATVDPFTGFNIYAAAKAGVNLFTKCIADEGKRLNIRAAAIAPGAVETPMLRQNFPEKAIPTSKTLDPMAVAGAILDLVTGDRDHEPGETIVLPSPV